PNHQKVDPLDIPSFNPDDYKDVATQVYNTNKTFSGNISLGTKENPEIIYVGGDLKITGNVSGYGVFIVKGNILINGNVTITSIDPTGNNLGLYSKGDINVNGNVTRSEEHTSELQSRENLVCRLLLEKKKQQ